jgi:hypothetical protein
MKIIYWEDTEWRTRPQADMIDLCPGSHIGTKYLFRRQGSFEQFYYYNRNGFYLSNTTRFSPAHYSIAFFGSIFICGNAALRGLFRF